MQEFQFPYSPIFAGIIKIVLDDYAHLFGISKVVSPNRLLYFPLWKVNKHFFIERTTMVI